MATKKSEVISDNEVDEAKPKTCFVIMPIADHPDYEPGHFNRVYEHLIKPACIKAGLVPKRADDSKASHMIMFDILKKIMDCDMAICDLSSKNANVFYELGLRQAFNKKTILITDGREKAPFDIAGFRYVTYSASLRVDSVETEIELINEMLTETESAPEDDVNSIVKLLKIKPAHVDPVQLNQNESVIFNMFTKLQDKIENLASIQSRGNLDFKTTTIPSYLDIKKSFSHNEGLSLYDLSLSYPLRVSQENYMFNGKFIGKLVSMDNEIYTFKTTEGRLIKISNTPDIERRIFVAHEKNI